MLDSNIIYQDIHRNPIQYVRMDQYDQPLFVDGQGRPVPMGNLSKELIALATSNNVNTTTTHDSVNVVSRYSKPPNERKEKIAEVKKEVIPDKGNDYETSDIFLDTTKLDTKHLDTVIKFNDFDSIMTLSKNISGDLDLSSMKISKEHLAVNVTKEEVNTLIEFITSIPILANLKNTNVMSKQLDDVVCDIVNTMMPNINITDFYSAIDPLSKHLKDRKHILEEFVAEALKILKAGEYSVVNSIDIFSTKQEKTIVYSSITNLSLELSNVTYEEIEIPANALVVRLLEDSFKDKGMIYLYDGSLEAVFEVRNNDIIRRIYTK